MTEQPNITVNVESPHTRIINILITLCVAGGLTAIAYHLSQGPLADTIATAVTIFLVTLVSYCFKAGILRLPESQTDDLQVTKSTLRKIYDELTNAVVNSSILRLIAFAALYTTGVMILRAGVTFLFGLLTSMWMAIGAGLLIGALLLGQEAIFKSLKRIYAHRDKGV